MDDEHRYCPACEACAREAWEEERHAFLCDGHPDDLMPPFACGWCGLMVGSNGAQARDCGGTICEPDVTYSVAYGVTEQFFTCKCPVEKVPIYLDSSGTAWHTLCAVEKEL